MKNKKEQKTYNAAMVLVFVGLVLMLFALMKLVSIAPVMGVDFVMGALAAGGFGYFFTVMGFIILRESENNDALRK
jgi:uncharacterized membrane protein